MYRLCMHNTSHLLRLSTEGDSLKTCHIRCVKNLATCAEIRCARNLFTASTGSVGMSVITITPTMTLMYSELLRSNQGGFYFLSTTSSTTFHCSSIVVRTWCFHSSSPNKIGCSGKNNIC
ncbi:MAG: hypothetical protein [Circular genetic element sp.]|nr:MAG: hypothetical protein [Circular genetic element sp.]